MKNDIRFNMKTWNRMEMNRGNIVTELIPVNINNRKWVSINPLEPEDKRGAYRYFEIELPRKFIDDDLDWFADDEITEEIFVASLGELYQLLENREIDPLAFDTPWKFNYPHAS